MILKILCLVSACLLWIGSVALLRNGLTAMRTRELPPKLQKLRRVCRARSEHELFVKVVERCFAFGMLLFLLGLLLALIPFLAL